MTLFCLGLLVLVAMVLSAVSVDLFAEIFRRRGRYPAKGQVSMEDVKELVVKGEHILAMKAYREITGASLKETRTVIEGMAESIPEPPEGGAPPV